jgi:SAM-dependent methyltransferase
VAEPPSDARIFKRFRARHVAWSTPVVLWNDGTFTGGVASPDGRWTLDGDTLLLAWHHWPPTMLKSDGRASFFSVNDPGNLTLYESDGTEDDSHLGGNIHGGDADTFYPRLWAWLVTRFSVRSVLDVGCGEGHALAEFERLGARAVGIDGLRHNVIEATHKGLSCIEHDFTTGPPPIHEEFDLGWSCEFVEHVDERFLDNILGCFAMCRVVAMTHARPGQGGYHHVNCQSSEYWIAKLSSVGFALSSDDTTFARRFYSGTYWGITGLIFLRTT